MEFDSGRELQRNLVVFLTCSALIKSTIGREPARVLLRQVNA